MKQYYISKNKVKQGPFLLEELMKKRLTPDTLILHQGSTGWKPAGEIGELKGLFTTAVANTKKRKKNFSEIAIINNSEDDISYWLLKTLSVLLMLLFFGQVVKAIAQ